MEELRSTEILDKEIQSDARKKAEKILKSSDVECSAILASVSDRIDMAKKEIKDDYSKKLEQFAHDVKAVMPLEKKRYLVSFASTAVNGAIDDYLKKLTDAKRFVLVTGMFERCRNAIDGKKVNALYYGIDKTKVNKFLKKELGGNLVSCAETNFEKTGQDAIEHINIHAGIILETEDRSVRCRLTTDELVLEIKDAYNKKLVNELFGGGR